MKIRDHRLRLGSGEPVPFRESPNHGGLIDPRLLVMHFTASDSAEGSISWLSNRKSKVSAHVVIGRDGSVTQLVPLNQKANHAGKSVWNGRQWVNGFSIGIELVNAGKLERKGGKWTSSFGSTEPGDEVLEGQHKNEKKPAGWQRYTPDQLRAAMEVASVIVQTYGITEIVGHEDVSPGRKNDPGPAFPMEAFRKDVFARANMTMPAAPVPLESGEPEVRPATALEYVVVSETFLRRNPSPRSKKVKSLAKGTVVRPQPQTWWLVEIVGGKAPVKGWAPVADLMRAAEAMTPPAPIPEEPIIKPTSKDAAERRLAIARKIVDFEARRDSKGRITVYRLPSIDGGGSYEVAGINERYHPDQAARLRKLINSGKQDEAEVLAAEYIASYTDTAGSWSHVGSIEAFLRDSAFNRGPTGAAKILQIALGLKSDGRIGTITIEALRKAEQDSKKLLTALRQARETYELRVVGRRAKFWKGLVNRWNNALQFAESVA